VSDKHLIFHIALIFVAVKIPVIVVFTKYDLLVVEHFRDSSHIPSLPHRKVEAKKRAEKALKEVTKDFPFPFVSVSTKQEYRGPLLGL
jgi:GTPase